MLTLENMAKNRVIDGPQRGDRPAAFAPGGGEAARSASDRQTVRGRIMSFLQDRHEFDARARRVVDADRFES